MQKEIMEFIAHFTFGGRYDQVIDSFTCGNCYWFAKILYERFKEQTPEIVYDVAANHFGTAIRGHIYDITGEVTDKYVWIDWERYDDESHKERIVKNCVNF